MSQWRPSRVKIAPLLAVPTSFSQRFPSTKKSRVGMDCTPYQKLRLGLSSASTRTTSTTPAHDVNTSTSTGSMIWQDLLQAAQNATRMGLLDCRTAGSKSRSHTDLKVGFFWGAFIFSTAVLRCQYIGQPLCQGYMDTVRGSQTVTCVTSARGLVPVKKLNGQEIEPAGVDEGLTICHFLSAWNQPVTADLIPIMPCNCSWTSRRSSRWRVC